MTSDDGAGWRAYMAGGDDDDPDVEVVVYCATCAVREFGATPR
jgi:hypothetical protein